MPFTLNDWLSARLGITIFSGKTAGSDSGLLALNDASTANNVAVEIRDADKHVLRYSRPAPVAVDAQGNAVLAVILCPNYIATADNL